MSMSRCSARVLTVCGRVGLVEDGSTLGASGDRDDVRRVATARALGVVGVDPRPAMAASVSSTKPASLRVSECSATCTPAASATVRHASIAAGSIPSPHAA